MPKSPGFQVTVPAIAEALRQADESFAKKGDPLEALDWIALAAKSGEPIPPRIGEWLHRAVRAYTCGEAKSMDAAMGLSATGNKNPRRRKKAQSRLDGLLSEMMLWVAHGATADEAAYLVSLKVTDYTEATLADRFKRSKMKLGARARALRQHVKQEAEFAQRTMRYSGSTFDPLGFVAQALAALPQQDWRTRKIADRLRSLYSKLAT